MATKKSSARSKSASTVSKVAAPKNKPTPKPKPASKSPAWTAAAILAQLESLGDAARREFNAKHGAGQNQFGVKLGDLRTLAKKIKPNQDLALALWKTKNVEAQLLATLLVKPAELTAKQLEQMVRSVEYMQLADWLHSYVVKQHPEKESLRAAWMTSSDKMAARAGWQLTAGRVAKSPAGLDLVALLDRIESEMPTAAPEVQWTMNMCLAEIGINFPQHRQRALDIGERLGIYRDYPTPKGCTSPFAPIWINEMVRRQG